MHLDFITLAAPRYHLVGKDTVKNSGFNSGYVEVIYSHPLSLLWLKVKIYWPASAYDSDTSASLLQLASLFMLPSLLSIPEKDE